MKFQGETGKVLKIKLPSAIEKSSWGANEVAVGGRVMLEVRTVWVSDGSDIQIKVRDAQGNLIEVLKGNIYYNCFRTQYFVAKANTTGGMFFEAEMEAHKLKATSHKIKVLPKIEWSQIKWMDQNKNILTEIAEGQLAHLSATVQSLKDGTEGYFEIFFRKSETAVISISIIKCMVKDSKLAIQWKPWLPGTAVEIASQTMLDKVGEKYFQPEYYFEANCMGSFGKSENVKLTSSVAFNFDGHQGETSMTLPDGSKQQKNVSNEGMLHAEKPKVGSTHLLNFEGNETTITPMEHEE